MNCLKNSLKKVKISRVEERCSFEHEGIACAMIIGGTNMRIGLDIDDTICNTNFILMKYAYRFNNENDKKELLKYNTNDFSKVFGWNNDEVDSFF